jgi:hypothetical protein
MLIKIRRGAFNPQSGDLEPAGDELWAGGDEELSAAILNAMNNQLEPATWYKLEEFTKLLAQIRPTREADVPSAITVEHPGVCSPWSTAIQIGESTAALMICRSVVEYVQRLRDARDDVWVTFE